MPIVRNGRQATIGYQPNINVCTDIDAEAFEEWFTGEFE